MLGMALVPQRLKLPALDPYLIPPVASQGVLPCLKTLLGNLQPPSSLLPSPFSPSQLSYWPGATLTQSWEVTTHTGRALPRKARKLNQGHRVAQHI